jgi:hypothetical protein
LNYTLNIKCEAVYDSVNCSKPGYTSITCSQIKNIPYNLIFTTKVNDSSILITIISNDYLNLSLANGYVGDVTIPTQVIQYNQHFLHNHIAWAHHIWSHIDPGEYMSARYMSPDLDFLVMIY